MTSRAQATPGIPVPRVRLIMDRMVMAMGRRPVLLLASPVALFLLVFFLSPFLSLFRVSLASNPGGSGYGAGTPFYREGTWTIDNYVRFFNDAYFLKMALFTIQFGVLVCIISTVVSFAFAYQIYRSPPWLKSVLLLTVILPKFTNVLVLMYGLLVVFGTSGLLNRALLAVGAIDKPLILLFNLFGVLLGETILVMPYCVLVILAVLHSIDRSLIDAAQGLGASRLRAFWEVSLPLSLPGVWVSVVLSFMWGVGAFAAPYLLGNPDLYTLAVEVDNQVNARLNWAMGATIAFVLMGIIGGLIYVYGRVQRSDAEMHA